MEEKPHKQNNILKTVKTNKIKKIKILKRSKEQQRKNQNTNITCNTPVWKGTQMVILLNI